MKYANNICLRAFCHQDEDKDAFEETFFGLLGLNEEELTEQKVPFEKMNSKGFNDKKIVIYTAIIEKDKHCNKFLDNLKENLTESDKKILLEQENRLDDAFNFYLRLDKEALMKELYVVTDSGNCFHIRMNIAAFPKKKEAVREVLKQIFQNNI